MLAIVSALVLLAAVSADEIVLPAPTGAARVGRASFARVDVSRPEPFTEDANDHRQVLFDIWYPAAKEGGTPAPYLDFDTSDDLFRRSYAFVGIEKMRRTRGHAFAGVAVSPAQKRYPVVLFSHGLGTVSQLYTTLIEDLASHGYIVAGVNHPYFSGAMRLPGGRIVKNESKRPWFTGDPTPEQQAELIRIRNDEALTQAQDLRFVLDELERLNARDPEGRFTGRLDLKHAGVFGHSRGGFAAPHAAFLDSRFDAALNLDGYRLTNAVMDNGIAQPYMHIEDMPPWEPEEPTDAGRAEADAGKKEWETTFSKMRGGAYVVIVKGTLHASFSDEPVIAPELFPKITIDARRALEITSAYAVAFFDRYLRGKRSALLEGKKTFPEVTLQTYNLRPQR